MTTNTNTTTADDVLGSVRSQLKDRLAALQGEIARLDALTREAARIERALATLDAPDAAEPAAVPTPTPTPEPSPEPRTPRKGSRKGGSRAATNGTHAPTVADTMIAIMRDTGPIASGDLIKLAAAAMPARAKSHTFKQNVYTTLSANRSFKRGPDKLWSLTKRAATIN